MIYIKLISALLLVYFSVILLMGSFRKKQLTNFIFAFTTVFFYAIYLIKLARGVGINNYYFHESLATANISPFMFTILPIVYFSRGKAQKYLYLLVSLLSVGMFLSPVLNAITYEIKGNTFGIIFAWDYIAHLSLSLWGIYLVKSGQVRVKATDSLISSSIIYAVCGLMIALNLLFDTSFFGLSLTGKHHIYYNVITENSYLSAAIFLTGLCVVLLAGYLLSKHFEKK